MSHAAEQHPHPTTTVSTSTGPKNVLKSKTVMKGSIVKINQLPTQSSLGTVFANTSSVIFDLRGNSVAFAKKIRFSLTIQNTDGTNAATLVNVPFLISQIALQANGGEGVTNLYPETDWFIHLPSLDTEKTTLYAALQNWSPSTYSSVGNTIAAGASVTYYFELNCMINQSGIPIHESVSAPWRFQLYFCPNPLISTSAMTTVGNLNLTNCQMWIVGEELSSRGLRALQDQMKSMDHEYHSFTAMRQVLPQGTLASAAQISSTLTGFDGTFAALYIFLRQANASGSARPEQQYQMDYTAPYTPSKFELANISLLKSDGSPYWVNNIPEALIRLGVSRDYFDTIFPTIFYSYPFIFNDTPVSTNENGELGMIKVQTNWQLQ